MEYAEWVGVVAGQERWRGYSLMGCEQLVRDANGQIGGGGFTEDDGTAIWIRD